VTSVTWGGGTRPARADRAPGAAGAVPLRPGLLQRPLASYHLVVWTGAALLVLGMVMVFSASSVKAFGASGSSWSIVAKQLVFAAIGLPLAAVASRLPVRVFRALGYPLLVASVLGLLLVLVPGVGVHAFGATRWIDLPGGIQVQPSEPAKVALALWGADLLVRKERLLGDWKHLVVPLLPVTALFAVLIMLEPDLGTTTSMLLVVVALLFVVGAPLRLFGGFLALVATLVALLAVAEPYRLARLTSFSNPCQHALGKGLQGCHGLYALGSGGWWGVGLGASREKWSYLPNAHTDFIFAILGEELGLLGTLTVVALFGVLGYAGLRIATRTGDPFVRLASAAVTTWLVGQALINMGYVAGMLPVTGVPLPLISFGGTSLVLTLACVGMLAAFARHEPGAATALAARTPGRLRSAVAWRPERHRAAVAPRAVRRARPRPARRPAR